MIQYILYVFFLLAGFLVAYFILINKTNNWNQLLLVYLDQFKKGGKTISDSVLPQKLQPVGIAIQTLFKEYKSEPLPPVIKETGDDVGNIKKQLNNTLIINELGQKLTSSLQIEATFQHLFITLNSIMDAAVVELGIYDGNKESWRIYSNLKETETANYANHIAEWVRVNNRVVYLDDCEKDFSRYVNKPLLLPNNQLAQSLMSFPLVLNDEVLGTITIISFRKNAFDTYHKESIEHLLGFTAVAIENASTHEKLNLLKIRAEESEKHEQQFLANMSHEIRTPMNAVLGMTHLLLDTEINERQKKYLSAINISSKNLLVIINDILDLSKLEAGKMEIEKIPFRIRDVIQNVSDTNRFKGEEKGLNFEINISPDLPEVVKGDPTRLNQVLTNLCSNAIKFTDKGKITISVDNPPNSHFVRFRVIDSGIGIPDDKLHLLFSNFKQVDSSTFRKYGGTGLGLSISKTLIELQGGKVEVKSTLGVGSEFSVQVPYEIGTIADVEALNQNVPSDYSALNGIRILVAEDNEYNQIVVNDTLETLIDNLHIDIAENGLIALEMQKTGNYDIILMDAQMPEMDGLDATRAIRKLSDEKKSKIPIIALTASVHKADIDKCIQSGMNGFVPKPFTRDELLGTIAKFYHNSTPQPVVKKENKLVNNAAIVTNENQSKMAQNPTVTNMEFLTKFTESDRERMKKYINLYLKLLPDNMAKIGAAIAAKDNSTLVKVMHSMRPHLKYMGMDKASELAAEIEKNITESIHLEKVEEMTKVVLENCSLSKSELENKLTTLN